MTYIFYVAVCKVSSAAAQLCIMYVRLNSLTPQHMVAQFADCEYIVVVVVTSTAAIVTFEFIVAPLRTVTCPQSLYVGRTLLPYINMK